MLKGHDMTFTDDLRHENAVTWAEATGHRFVTELIAGSIAPGVMARYLVQDHRFLDAFLRLIGAAIASADRFESRLVLGRFTGLVSGEENTYFLRAFEALGVTKADLAVPDTPATAGFRAIMEEAAETRSYAAALAVLNVAEGLYLDWASTAEALPESFVHAEWITLHAGEGFAAFVAFLRAELDRVGPAEEAICRDLFARAVGLEKDFFDQAYA